MRLILAVTIGLPMMASGQLLPWSSKYSGEITKQTQLLQRNTDQFDDLGFGPYLEPHRIARRQEGNCKVSRRSLPVFPDDTDQSRAAQP
jgi:hypothetical protein